MPNRLNQVVRELRGRILRGELKAGERITETAAADMLGVSRTPVRLALSILEHENLVEGEPNKGFRVCEYKIEDYEQTLAVRAELDGMAARLAAQNRLEPDIGDELDAVIRETEALLEKDEFSAGDLQTFARSNADFHDALARASGNRWLRRMLEREIPLRFRSAPLIFSHVPAMARELIQFAHDEHIAILEAVRAGESARADFLMQEHVQNPHRNLKKMMAELDLQIEHEAEDIMLVATRALP